MVHIAMVPLEGMESIEQTLGRLYPDVLALHCMVLVSAPPEDSASISGVHMFDFLPLTPPDPVTTARLLSGQYAQGQLRKRVLARLPRRRCWRIGPATGSLQVTLTAQTGLDAHVAYAPAAVSWPVWPVCKCTLCVLVTSFWLPLIAIDCPCCCMADCISFWQINDRVWRVAALRMAVHLEHCECLQTALACKCTPLSAGIT